MPLQIPTTKELAEQYVAQFERSLNQNIPLADKAFLRVLAIVEATMDTILYKFGQERSIQNLALTATGDDLDAIGREHKVYRKSAESWQGKIQGDATNGTIIPINVDFVSDSNNERYIPDSSATADINDEVVVTVSAKVPGVNSNLELFAAPTTPETMTIGRQIAGVLSTTFEVIEILNVGAERESDDAYRRRVLGEIRTVGGGGNSADYRRWSEEVAGILATYPYAGKPIGEGTGLPGDRTVYSECTEAIDPDGIPPAALLEEVRETINFDPITGEARPPLGEINDTLYVRAIRRTEFLVEIRNLTVSPELETQLKTDVNAALEFYFKSVEPFILGLDFEGDRNDTLTNLTVSTVVQATINAAGGAASSVGFGITPGVFEYIYQLGQGEKAKLGGVTYV